MAALTWSEALALQQPQMDTTHREFVELLAAVEQALDGLGPEAVRERYAAFVDHTEAHFAQEDRWMTAIGFAAENCHAFQHAGVLRLLREVQAVLAREHDAELLRRLVAELAVWFPAHAQQMDAALAQVMGERGFDPLSGLAARPPAADEPAITGCGGTSCR